jgi:hypothetical protein
MACSFSAPVESLESWLLRRVAQAVLQAGGFRVLTVVVRAVVGRP